MHQIKLLTNGKLVYSRIPGNIDSLLKTGYTLAILKADGETSLVEHLFIIFERFI